MNEAQIILVFIVCFIALCWFIAWRQGKAQKAKDLEDHKRFIERMRKQSEHLKRKKI